MGETSGRAEAIPEHGGLGAVAPSLRPDRLVPGLAAGAVGGIVAVMLSISFATLIFSGSLSSHLAQGLSLGLLSVVVLNLAAAWGSSFRSVVSNVQDPFAIIVAVAAASIAGALSASSPTHVLPTVLALIALTTLSVGAFFLGLGAFRLGRFVRFVPFPVIGGFLAGTGWAIAVGAVQVLTGIPFTRSNLQVIVEGAPLGHLLAGALVAGTIILTLKRVSHSLALPALLALFAGLFYVVLLVTGTPITSAEAHGWLLGPLPSGTAYRPLTPGDLRLVDWTALAGQAGTVVTVMVTSAVAFLLNIAGLEAESRDDIDLDRELRTMGIGNLVSGVGTGLGGYHSVSASLVAQRIEAASRVVPVAAAAVAGVALVGGPVVLAYVPRFIVGGLLLYLGVSLLIQWVVRGWTTMPALDYATVLVILVVIGEWGFLAGLLVGIALGIILFVVTYSRTGIIKYELSGQLYRSNVDRSERELRVLTEHGDRLFIIALQGFLFFGTTSRLLDRIQELTSRPQRRYPCYIIVDCRLVTGADASVPLSFARLGQLAAREGVQIVLTGLEAPIRQAIGRAGQVDAPDSVFHVFPDLDHGLEWCENQILEAEHTLTKDRRSAVDELAASLRSESLARRLMPYLKRLEIPPDTRVIMQGDPSDAVYLVESGQLTVVLEHPPHPGIRLRTVSAGALIGEIGFHLDSPRTASVITTEPTVLYSLTREAMADMQARDPDVVLAFTQMIARLLAERLTTANETIGALVR